MDCCSLNVVKWLRTSSIFGYCGIRIPAAFPQQVFLWETAMSPGLKGQNKESRHRSQLSPNFFHEVGWTHTSTWGANAEQLSSFHLCRWTSAWFWCNGSTWKNTVVEEVFITCMMKKMLPGEEHPCFTPSRCPSCPCPRGQVTAQALRAILCAAISLPAAAAAAAIPENLEPVLPKCQAEEANINTEHAAEPSRGTGAGAVTRIPPLLPGQHRHLWKGDTLGCPAEIQSWD